MKIVFDATKPKVQSPVSEKECVEYAHLLSTLVEIGGSGVPESALSLPFVPPLSISEVAPDCIHPEHVVLVGIGGSCLGVSAIFSALKTPTSPKLTILDVPSEPAAHKLVTLIAKEKTPREKLVICVITKSGVTTETIANTTFLLKALETQYGQHMGDRVIVISNAHTPYQTFAVSYGAHFAPIPDAVGGRFSVFSAVGTIPLELLGIDVALFLKGARETIEAELHKHEGSAVRSAVLMYNLWNEGYRILNTFVLGSTAFSELACWFQQLHGESLGKQTNKDGAIVDAGFVPLVTTPRDLHSMGQLLLGGGRGIYTKFLLTKDVRGSLLTHHSALSPLPYLDGKSLSDVQDAIASGTIAAYTEHAIPHSISEISTTAEDIGAYMAYSMIETLYLADLFGVPAFNQPNVELYKEHTRIMLGG